MLFRKKMCEEEQYAEESAGVTKKLRQADLSKKISQKWKTLTLNEKEYWKALEQAKKAWHDALYPNYVYRPGPRKKRKRKAELSDRGESEDSETQICRFVFFSPNDAENYGMAPASDQECGGFIPQPSPTTSSDDKPAIPEQALPISIEGREAEPAVVFAQSFEPSTVSDVTCPVRLHPLCKRSAIEHVYGTTDQPRCSDHRTDFQRCRHG